MAAESKPFITPDGLLSHWQGHRRLTRRVITAFPDDKVFTFSLGGMRPFGALVMEMITMTVPMVRGAVSGDWSASRDRDPRPKHGLLELWDESPQQLNTLWPQIPPERFQETSRRSASTGTPAQPRPVRHRQRDPPPGSGLRVLARARHRAAGVLRSELTVFRPDAAGGRGPHSSSRLADGDGGLRQCGTQRFEGPVVGVDSRIVDVLCARLITMRSRETPQNIPHQSVISVAIHRLHDGRLAAAGLGLDGGMSRSARAEARSRRCLDGCTGVVSSGARCDTSRPGAPVSEGAHASR